MELVRNLIGEELVRIRGERGDARFENGQFTVATHLFEELIEADVLQEFLTLKTYELID
jgi:hypothetical protein